MRSQVIAEACQTARSMHRRFGVREPMHIKVEAWATKLGFELVEAKLDGANAQLVRLGDRVQIVLPEYITDRGSRRFGIAHEIYHYLKKHPSSTPTMMCAPKALRGGDETA